MAGPANQGDTSINLDNAARQTSAFGSAAEIRCSSLDPPLAGREMRSTLDVPDQGSIRVAVQDADDLVHPGTSTGVVRLKTRTGKRLVYIAGNRARLV